MTDRAWQIVVYDPPRAFESLEAFYRADERRRTDVHGGPYGATDIFYDGHWPAFTDERQRVVYSGVTHEIYVHPFDPGPLLDERVDPMAQRGTGYDPRTLGPVQVFGTVTSWRLLEVILDGELDAHMKPPDNVGWLIARLSAAARLEQALADEFAP